MSESTVYRQLERPWIYRLSQKILGPGGESFLTSKIRELIGRLPDGAPLLDSGCGPASWLWRVQKEPIGLDFSPSYAWAYSQNGRTGVVGSASELPFASESFQGVWSIGLLHHLPDGQAAKGIQEMVRVCKKGGYVAIFDGVLPRRILEHPAAWAIRRLDRGSHFRTQEQFERLLPEGGWRIERVCYTKTGLEGLVCTLEKNGQRDSADTRN